MKCKYCDGTGKIDPDITTTDLMNECRVCNGFGWLDDNVKYVSNVSTCSSCGGSGKSFGATRCVICRGSGKVIDVYKMVECNECDGTGKARYMKDVSTSYPFGGVTDDWLKKNTVIKKCRECGGSGKLKKEAGYAPKKSWW